MSVRTHQIEGGARVLLFTCEGCGAPALFGVDCRVLEAVHTGDVGRAGRWYCGARDGVPCCVAEAKRQAVLL